MRLKVPLDCVEGFVAQVVLDFACVVQGGFLRDAQAHKQLAEDGVALVDVGRDGAAFLGQVDVVILIDGDQPALAHLAQDDGDRRAGIGEIRADVNGVNLVLLLRENVDRFQIVFDGFGYGHSQNHLHAPTARDARAQLYQLHYNIIPKFKQRESKKFGLFFCARAIDKSVSRC